MESTRKLIKRTKIPITIENTGLVSVVANFHKPYGTPVLPVVVDAQCKTSRFTMKSKDDKYHHPDKKNINLKYYDLSVQSKAIDDRIFRFKIPINFKKNEESQQYISLNFGNNRGSMQMLKTYVDASEVILENETGLNLNFEQRFKIQQSMMGNRRKELTDKDVMDMQEEEESEEAL